ncbi:hypothetical protein TNCV_2556691 [Trichonephila clavipes]|nr:hypothetical protein TNCV_2556691 [Trichonephila clavipes]
MKVAGAFDRLDFYTIDGDTTYLHLHNFGMELERERNICSLAPCTRGFCCDRPQDFQIDLTSTYSICVRKVFGGIQHRTKALRSGVRCSNRWATHGPNI